MEETKPFPTQPPCNDTRTASGQDLVPIVSDTDDRIMKAVEELQDFVSEVYKNSFKLRLIGSRFKKQ
jgi:hypothetical protein